MPSRSADARRTDSELFQEKHKKTGFDLLEHVTGGIHVITAPDNGRVVHRPLDHLNDAELMTCDISPAGPRKHFPKRRRRS